MSELFTFRRAGRVDLPRLAQLFIESKFLRSGPPNSLREDEIQGWLADRMSFPIVACLKTTAQIVGHIQMCRKITASRASRAELEDVCVHPDWEGHGLARAMLGRGIWWAEHRWQATRIEWTSEVVPERERARTVLYPGIGAEPASGTNCRFRLRLPYDPVPWGMEANYVNLYDS